MIEISSRRIGRCGVRIAMSVSVRVEGSAGEVEMMG
jgi:hypothetical protein